MTLLNIHTQTILTTNKDLTQSFTFVCLIKFFTSQSIFSVIWMGFPGLARSWQSIKRFAQRHKDVPLVGLKSYFDWLRI